MCREGEIEAFRSGSQWFATRSALLFFKARHEARLDEYRSEAADRARAKKTPAPEVPPEILEVPPADSRDAARLSESAALPPIDAVIATEGIASVAHSIAEKAAAHSAPRITLPREFLPQLAIASIVLVAVLGVSSVSSDARFVQSEQSPLAAGVIESIGDALKDLVRLFGFFAKEDEPLLLITRGPEPVTPAAAPTKTLTATPAPTHTASGTTVRNITQNVTNQTFVTGVTQGALTTALNSLRSSLDQELAMLRSHLSMTNNTTALIARVEDLTGLDLHDGDIDNSRFVNGTITGSTVGATTLSVSGDTNLATTTVSGPLTVSGALSAGALSISSLSASGFIEAPYFTATSTMASTFPFASTTALSASYASSTQGFLGTLTLGTLNGPLQANNGLVSATSSIGVLYGGTGLTSAPTYGQLLVGNSAGGYTLTATTSLGLVRNAADLALPNGYVYRGSAGGFAEATSSLYVSNAGNIGIGTLAPTSALHLQATTSGVYSALSINNNIGNERVRLSYDVANVRLGIGVGGTPGTPQFSVDSNGNVGIGTNSSDNDLEIGLLGTFQMQTGSVLFTATPTPGATDGLVYDTSPTGYWRWKVNGTNALTVNADGTVTVHSLAGAGTYCVQADANGVLSTTGAACGSGSGAVNSVSNANGTLTISPTTGAVVASLNLGNANTWTALQRLYGNASTTQLSSTLGFFGGTATSTFNAAGQLTLAGAFNGPLQANNGLVSATSSIGVLYGGTGTTTAPSSQLLYGGGSGVYQSIATSSLVLGSSLSYSGTLGSLVGGAGGTLSVATSSLYTGSTGQVAYFTGTNALAGTSTLQISTTQTVGIGTTTPAAKLGVAGSVYAGSGGGFSTDSSVLGTQSLYFGFAGDTYTYFGSGGAGTFSIAENGVGTRLHIDTNGNIGIGTTTPATKLQVQGSVMLAGGGELSSSAYWDGSAWRYTTTAVPGYVFRKFGTNILQFGTFAEGTAGNTATLNSTLFFDTTNNRVGIATSSPFATLSVAGTLASNAIIPNGPYTNNLSAYDLGATGSRWNALWAGTLNIGTSTWSINNGTNGRLSIFNAASGGGTERFTILTSGEVGIGTTTPSALLALTTSGAGGILRLYRSDAPSELSINFSGALANFEISGGSDYVFKEGGTEWVRFAGTGNIGIGSSSPKERLVIGGGGATGGIIIQGSLSNWMNVGATGVGIDNDGTNARIWSSAGDGIAFFPAGTQRMTLTSAGSLGIGTTSPVAKLSVVIGESFASLGNSSAFQIASSSAGTATTTLFDINSYGNAGIGTIAATPSVFGPGNRLTIRGATGQSAMIGLINPDLVFLSSGSFANIGFGAATGDTYLSIAASTQGGNASGNIILNSSGGKVGIGTTSPYAKFAIEANAGDPDQLFAIGSSTNTLLYVNDGGSLVADGNVQAGNLLTWPNTVTTGSLTICRGTVFGVSYPLICTSLSKYKKNQQTLTIGLETVMRLHPVEFDWDAEHGGYHDLGFIAEEVESVNPLLAEYDPNTGKLTGVKYPYLTSLLAKSIQELNVNLETVASSTYASSTPTSQAFAARFFSGIGAWLADAANGLTAVVARSVKAQEEICVDDQCLTKEDVRALIQLANGGAGSGSSGYVPPAPPEEPPAPPVDEPPAEEPAPEPPPAEEPPPAPSEEPVESGV